MTALDAIPRPLRITAFLVTVGIVSGTTDWYNASRASQALSWPSTSGTVLSSSASRGWLSGKRFFADVTYSYSVGGQAYTSSRVQFQAISEGRNYSRVLKQVAAQYPVGGAVSVFYDPASPSSAILRPQPPDWTRGWWLLGAISTLGLILGGIEWLRGRL